jgi:hypothetical protein
MRGSEERGAELVPVELLTAAVPLDHLDAFGDGPLVGGEAVAARRALAAAADGAVRHAPGLEGLGGGVAAWTVHLFKSTGA